MLVIALDLGGSHVTCALISDRTCLAERTANIGADSFQQAIPVFESLIEEVLHAAQRSAQDCQGVVLGFPGIVDAHLTRVVSTNAKFDDARGFDLLGWAMRRFGLKLGLENDARLAVMGEQYCGAATDAEDVVLVTLGTGIGCAAMNGGKPLRGAASQAGCLGGHLPVVLKGRRCTCGNLGCAEAEASTWALAGICREWPGYAASSLTAVSKIGFAQLFSASDQGDTVAREVLTRCIDVWSSLAVALIHAYTPQILLFGGSVMARQADILPPIRDYVRQHAWLPQGEVAIEPAALGSAAALYGAVPFLSEVLS